MRKNRSSYASGVAPSNIKVDGPKVTGIKELKTERAAMLKVLAAIIENAGGSIVIPEDTIVRMNYEEKIIQVIEERDNKRVILKFKGQENETVGAWIDSDPIREAREYLKSLRDKSSDVVEGSTETEQEA